MVTAESAVLGFTSLEKDVSNAMRAISVLSQGQVIPTNVFPVRSTHSKAGTDENLANPARGGRSHSGDNRDVWPHVLQVRRAPNALNVSVASINQLEVSRNAKDAPMARFLKGQGLLPELRDAQNVLPDLSRLLQIASLLARPLFKTDAHNVSQAHMLTNQEPSFVNFVRLVHSPKGAQHHVSSVHTEISTVSC